MSNIKDFIGGSGGFDPRTFKRIDILASQNWTVPPAKGNKFFVIVQAGGGSGGNSAANYWALGGNSGEGKYEWLELTEGDTISVTIGAGGTTPAGDYEHGSFGGDSSFGSFISCKGGSAGSYRRPQDDVAYYTDVGGAILTQFNTESMNCNSVWISCRGTGISTNTLLFKNETIAGKDLLGNRYLNGGGDDKIAGYGSGGGGSIFANGTDCLDLGSGTAPNAVMGAGSGGAKHGNAGNGGDGLVAIFYEER